MTLLVTFRGNKCLSMVMALLFIFNFGPIAPQSVWAVSIDTFDDGTTTPTVDFSQDPENPDEPAAEAENTGETTAPEGDPALPSSLEFLSTAAGVIGPATQETSGTEVTTATGETITVSSATTSGSADSDSPGTGTENTNTTNADNDDFDSTETTYDEDGNIVIETVPSSTLDDAFYVPGEGLAYTDFEENAENPDDFDGGFIEGYTYSDSEDQDDDIDDRDAENWDDWDEWEYTSFENPPERIPSFELRGSSLRARNVTLPSLTSTNAGLRARTTAYNTYYRAGTESLASTTGTDAATNRANETANREKVLARLRQFKQDLEQMNTELVRYFDHLLPLVLQDIDNGADVTAKRNLLINLTQARLWIKGPAEFLNLGTAPPTWKAGYENLARALGAVAVGHTEASGVTLSQWAANYFISGTMGLWVPYPPTIGRNATTGWVGITANRRNNGWLGFALEAEAKLGEANQALGNADQIWNGNSHTGAFRIGLAESWYALNRNGAGLVPQGAKQIINTTIRQMHTDSIAPPSPEPPPAEAPAMPSTQQPPATEPQTPPAPAVLAARLYAALTPGRSNWDVNTPAFTISNHVVSAENPVVDPATCTPANPSCTPLPAGSRVILNTFREDLSQVFPASSTIPALSSMSVPTTDRITKIDGRISHNIGDQSWRYVTYWPSLDPDKGRLMTFTIRNPNSNSPRTVTRQIRIAYYQWEEIRCWGSCSPAGRGYEDYTVDGQIVASAPATSTESSTTVVSAEAEGDEPEAVSEDHAETSSAVDGETGGDESSDESGTPESGSESVETTYADEETVTIDIADEEAWEAPTVEENDSSNLPENYALAGPFTEDLISDVYPPDGYFLDADGETDNDYDNDGIADNDAEGDDIDDLESLEFEMPEELDENKFELVLHTTTPNFRLRASNLGAPAKSVPPLLAETHPQYFPQYVLRENQRAFNAYFGGNRLESTGANTTNWATYEPAEQRNRTSVLTKLREFRQDLEEMDTELVNYSNRLVEIIMAAINGSQPIPEGARESLQTLTMARLWIRGPLEFLNRNTSGQTVSYTVKPAYADLRRALGYQNNTGMINALIGTNTTRRIGWIPYAPRVANVSSNTNNPITLSRTFGDSGWLGFAADAETKLQRAGNQNLGDARTIWEGTTSGSGTSTITIPGLAEAFYALNRRPVENPQSTGPQNRYLVVPGAKAIVNAELIAIDDRNQGPARPEEAPVVPQQRPQPAPELPPGVSQARSVRMYTRDREPRHLNPNWNVNARPNVISTSPASTTNPIANPATGAPLPDGHAMILDTFVGDLNVPAEIAGTLPPGATTNRITQIRGWFGVDRNRTYVTYYPSLNSNEGLLMTFPREGGGTLTVRIAYYEEELMLLPGADNYNARRKHVSYAADGQLASSTEWIYYNTPIPPQYNDPYNTAQGRPHTVRIISQYRNANNTSQMVTSRDRTYRRGVRYRTDSSGYNLLDPPVEASDTEPGQIYWR